MMLLAALEAGDPAALRDLLAQLRATKPGVLMRDQVERWSRGTGGWLSGIARSVAQWLRGREGRKTDLLERMAGESGAVLESMGDTLDEYARRRVTLLEDEVAAERRRLERLSPEVLRWKLLETLGELAGVDERERTDPVLVAREVLNACARHYEIEVEGLPTEEVERLVARAYLDDLQRQLVAAMDSGRLDEERLEQLVDQELERLAEGDAEKVKKALDVDQLSGKALLGAVRSGVLTLGTLSALGAGGFGPFLALSSLIKAVTLLLGVSASFGIYTAAASALGFLLSPVGMVLVAGAVITPGSISGVRRLRAAQLAGAVAMLHAVRYSDARRSGHAPDPGADRKAPHEGEDYRAPSRDDRCPRCGSTEIAFILYGVPKMTPHLQEALEQGRVVLGGNIEGIHHWYCQDCGHTFGED